LWVIKKKKVVDLARVAVEVGVAHADVPRVATYWSVTT